jgi:photosystem II stability/assembly factor-like uncharacterized protein
VKPRGSGPGITYIHFSSDQNGLIAGDDGFIRYTHDGGDNWYAPSHPRLSSGQFNEDIVAGSRRGEIYYLLTDLHLLKSQSNGESWEIMERPTSPDLFRNSQAQGLIVEYYDVSFANDDEGWVLCGILKKGKPRDTFLQSYLLHTDDAGESWRSTRLTPGRLMVRMHFADRSQGWIVGKEGTILYTNNGGENFVQQAVPVWTGAKASGSRPKLMDVDFKGKKGIVVGTLGTILRTDDGGRSWILMPQPSLKSRYFVRVQMLDDKSAWVVGESGIILSTATGGKFWMQEGNSTTTNLYALFMKNRRHGWAAGDDQTLLEYNRTR